MVSLRKSITGKIIVYVLTMILMSGCFLTAARAESSNGILGYVTISFEDTVERIDECDIEEPIGVIIADTTVEFYEGDSVSDVTYRLLDKLGISYVGTESYLNSINGFTVNDVYYEELGDYTCGDMSGWMFTYNNWFSDKGMNDIYVENGDIIEWKYTCLWGIDIGSDWSKESAKITSINLDSSYGTISPEFSTDIKDYTLTLAENVTGIKLSVDVENYNSIVTYSVGDTEYKYLREIPVEDGTVININSVYNSYSGTNDTDSITITVKKQLIKENISSIGNEKLIAQLEEYINSGISGRKTNTAPDSENLLGSEKVLSLVGTTSTDWLAFAMGRYSVKYSDGRTEYKYDDGEGYNDYLKALEQNVSDLYNANDGFLSTSKSTEWSRVIIALTALGADATDFGEYNNQKINLLADGTYNCVLSGGVANQGINGLIYAINAINTSKNVVIPEDAQYKLNDMIKQLLELQLKDSNGNYAGWALFGINSDVDITSMAIQALAPYYNDDTVYTYTNFESGEERNVTVKMVIDEALEKLSAMQNSNGGYSSWGSENAESIAQVLAAVTMVGIDPATDNRFIKNGNTLLDAILTFRVEDGSFAHIKSNMKYNLMATDQVLYALVSYWRFANGYADLYSCSNYDVKIAESEQNTPEQNTPEQTNPEQTTPEQEPSSPENPPANPGNNEVPTGDNSNIAVSLTLFVLSTILLTAFAGKKTHIGR